MYCARNSLTRIGVRCRSPGSATYRSSGDDTRSASALVSSAAWRSKRAVSARFGAEIHRHRCRQGRLPAGSSWSTNHRARRRGRSTGGYRRSSPSFEALHRPRRPRRPRRANQGPAPERELMNHLHSRFSLAKSARRSRLTAEIGQIFRELLDPHGGVTRIQAVRALEILG